jgi:uncharacterized integral membrane protein
LDIQTSISSPFIPDANTPPVQWQMILPGLMLLLALLVFLLANLIQ